MNMAQGSRLSELASQAGEAARLLKLIGNEKRLLILCHLIARKEMSVGALVEAIGLGQSALSQHLAKLREDGLVATRRQSQTILYRIQDPKAAQIIELLKKLFCPTLGSR
jgi:ArsR family transcriptional regulator, virulence genes transcriptional regulator